MVKNAWNVPDLPGLQPFDAAQGKIIILRTFKAFAEPADLTQNRSDKLQGD